MAEVEEESTMFVKATNLIKQRPILRVTTAPDDTHRYTDYAFRDTLLTLSIPLFAFNLYTMLSSERLKRTHSTTITEGAGTKTVEDTCQYGSYVAISE